MIRSLAKRLMTTMLRPLYRDIQDKARHVDKGTQTLLVLKYREMLRNGDGLPSFEDVGFRNYSQFDEDGILLYIFALIGTTNRVCVEMCAGIGSENNTANLILHHGWHGLLFDGNPDNVAIGSDFFVNQPMTQFFPPRFVHAWIDAANVNDLIRNQGVEGEIDLFSLDIDGMDYHIWKAIDCIRPRVVVLESNNHGWGPEASYTLPYKPDFAAAPGEFFGATLEAFTRLGREKGYRLVGSHAYGFNVFYLRDDVAPELFPAVSVENCLSKRFLTGPLRPYPTGSTEGLLEV